MEKKDLITLEPSGIQIAAFESEMTDLAEIIAENAGPGGLNISLLDCIKIPAGGGLSWSIPTVEGEQETRELSGVVLVFSDKRKYWSTSFDETGGTEAPDCFSPDTYVGIGQPGGECSKCEFSQFGSGKGNAQACRLVRLMALMCEDSILPRILSVPPSSYRVMQKYFLQLGAATMRYWEVVSKFSLLKAKSSGGITYSQIVPTMVRRLTPVEREKMVVMRENLGTLLDQDRVIVTEGA